MSIYSGSFNMKGMEASDYKAMQDITARSGGQPLIDSSKFLFFGEMNCLPETVQLGKKRHHFT